MHRPHGQSRSGTGLRGWRPCMMPVCRGLSPDRLRTPERSHLPDTSPPRPFLVSGVPASAHGFPWPWECGADSWSSSLLRTRWPRASLSQGAEVSLHTSLTTALGYLSFDAQQCPYFIVAGGGTLSQWGTSCSCERPQVVRPQVPEKRGGRLVGRRAGAARAWTAEAARSSDVCTEASRVLCRG